MKSVVRNCTMLRGHRILDALCFDQLSLFFVVHQTTLNISNRYQLQSFTYNIVAMGRSCSAGLLCKRCATTHHCYISAVLQLANICFTKLFLSPSLGGESGLRLIMN